MTTCPESYHPGFKSLPVSKFEMAVQQRTASFGQQVEEHVSTLVPISRLSKSWTKPRMVCHRKNQGYRKSGDFRKCEGTFGGNLTISAALQHDTHPRFRAVSEHWCHNFRGSKRCSIRTRGESLANR